MVGPLQQVKSTKNLEKFALEVLPKDLQTTMQYLFNAELAAQARLGAKPTTILIDNGKGQLANVKKSARAFFSNQARLIEAAHATWDMLIQLTRVKSGAARASYALYKNQQYVGGRGDIERVVKNMVRGEVIQIVGPGVAYGRHLYWNPLGKVRKVKKRIAKGKDRSGNSVSVYAVKTRGLHDVVQQAIARKYRDIFVIDKWVSLRHGTGKQGERWPAVWLGFHSSKQSLM